MGAELSEPATGPEEEEMLLPQWAIAVVVIGLASLAFVIIFGASMVTYKNQTWNCIPYGTHLSNIL